MDTTASITLVGGTPYKPSIGDTFTDPGSTVTDNLDTGLVADVKLEGALEGLVAHWTFDDAQGATAAESINGLMERSQVLMIPKLLGWQESLVPPSNLRELAVTLSFHLVKS